MPNTIVSLRRYPLILLSLSVLIWAACSTSAPVEKERPADGPAIEEDPGEQFDALVETAEQAFAQRADKARIDEAIEAWTEALDTETAGGDDEIQAEILESLARAHYFVARYHHGGDPYGRYATGAAGFEPDPQFAVSADAGIQAAERALRIRAPDFLRAVQHGAPFEEAFPEVSESAHDALLWYAKHRLMIATAGGVADKLETVAVADTIMEWVREHDPEAHGGAAHRYFGVHWVERPTGRNVERSRDAFEDSIETNPEFLLNRFLRARHLSTFDGDRRAFEEELATIVDAATDDSEPAAENAFVGQWAAQLLDAADQLFD